jgi:hypothetical protein
VRRNIRQARMRCKPEQVGRALEHSFSLRSYPALPTIDYTLDTGAGDCEDYAILKYVALREAGMSCNDLSILVVRYPPGLVQPVPLTPTPLISSQTSTACLVACVVVGPTIGAAKPSGQCAMLHVRWRSAARTNGKVVLFEGDGSLLMHIRELETIKRHRLKLLICVLNDGAYGAEIHKLRAHGVDDSGAIFGRTDLAAIATCVPTGLFFFGQPPRGHTRTGQAPQRRRYLLRNSNIKRLNVSTRT